MTKGVIRGGGRIGYARGTQVSNSLTNQETVGGPAKAGLGRGVGTVGQFVQMSIGNRAPTIAGPNYRSIGGKIDPKTGKSYISPARDIYGKEIKAAGKTLYYPISFSNQLGGVGGLERSQWVPSADGVNYAFRRNQVKKLMMPLGSGANARPALL